MPIIGSLRLSLESWEFDLDLAIHYQARIDYSDTSFSPAHSASHSPAFSSAVFAGMCFGQLHPLSQSLSLVTRISPN